MRQEYVLNRIKEIGLTILKENLVGIYVHGSLAFRCFNWEKSDIDFLIVTKTPPALPEKEALITELLHLDEKCPAKGLEMSVVLERYCKDFVYPTPFELHFSNAHKENCKSDLERYCRNMFGADRDLAAHFTVIREAGITLWGQDIPSVFGPVPKADYLDSIRSDIRDAVSEITEDPVYFILNLCRSLAYLQDNLILSKKQGGRWGMENLPAAYGPLIRQAVESYCGSRSFSAEDALLRQFAEDMTERLFPK